MAEIGDWIKDATGHGIAGPVGKADFERSGRVTKTVRGKQKMNFWNNTAAGISRASSATGSGISRFVSGTGRFTSWLSYKTAIPIVAASATFGGLEAGKLARDIPYVQGEVQSAQADQGNSQENEGRIKQAYDITKRAYLGYDNSLPITGASLALLAVGTLVIGSTVRKKRSQA